MKDVLIGSFGLAVLGLLFGFILSMAYQKLKVKEDPRLAQLLDMLPGVNCGACGFASCRALAEHVLETNSVPESGCIPGGKEVNTKMSEMVGSTAGDFSSRKAVLLCCQSGPQRKTTADYTGPRSCQLAQLTATTTACKYGCMGFGDCVASCKFDALKMVDGLPVVDYAKCTGCGKCVQACPRNLFTLVDASKNTELFIPLCSNPEDTLETKKVCRAGCIGCGICTKLIKESPYYLKEKLAKLDIEKLKGQDLTPGVQKCPTKVIRKIVVNPDEQRQSS